MKRILLVMLLCVLGTLTLKAQIVHTDNVQIEKSGDAKLDLTDTGNSKTWQLVSGLAGFQIGYLTGNLIGTNAPFHISEAGKVGIGTSTFDPNAVLTVVGGLDLAGDLRMDSDFNIIGGDINFFTNSTTNKNIFLGNNAGNSTMTGQRNMFFGEGSGGVNTTGTRNAWFGIGAGNSNTIGNDNTLFGFGTGFNNTSGNSNVFFGNASGRFNTTGSANVFVGMNSGFFNSSGVSNVFIGYDAGRDANGDKNVFLGNSAGKGDVNASNSLYIANDAYDQSGGSLIYGRFDLGQVGINTTTLDANAALTVGGEVSTTGLNLHSSSGPTSLKMESVNGENTFISFTEQNPSGQAEWKAGVSWFSPGNRMLIDSYDGGDIVLRNLNGGNVGIGVDAPNEKLEVDGNVKATGYFLNDGSSLLDIIGSGATPWEPIAGGVTFSTGNVGIGSVIDPDVNLHVAGYSAGINNVLSSIMIGKLNGPQIQAIQETNDDDVQGLAFRVKSSTAWADDSFEAMRISKDGEVGIGTDNPVANLDVRGNGNVAQFGNSVYEDQYISIRDYTNGGMLGITPTDDGGAFQLQAGNNKGMRFMVDGNSTGSGWSSGINAMEITRDGKIGINTTTPGNTLHVSSVDHGGLSLESPNQKNSFISFLEQNSSNVAELKGGLAWIPNSSGMALDTYDGGDIFLRTINGGQVGINATTLEPNSALTVGGRVTATEFYLESGLPFMSSPWTANASDISFDTGNVGIGVTSPTEKLEVDGNTLIQGDLEAMKVVVTANPGGGWPDYVFEPEFKLRSLSEVEAFVKDNKHLPEVPSAKDVAANGIDLGSMDATLLKKVEELTLYMIEMDKQIQKLKEENKELKELVKKDK